MNKLTFTVAAIIAAQASAQQQCTQPPLPVPDLPDDVLHEAADFVYMDQCPADGTISWNEYESFSPALSQTVRTREEMVRDFQKMDLNNDNQISANERIRYLQVLNSPLDLQGHLPPYAPIAAQLFDYLDCRPLQFNSEDTVCDQKYDRDDLKAVLHTLVDIVDIYEDHIQYEAYISHEFSLRDYNFDGYITRDEQNRHTWHYRFMRYFWNQSKDQGEDNWETVPGDSGIMTYEQWYQQDNRMLRREHCADEVACPIPDQKFINRFHYFDMNYDGQLSWWEYFSVIQEDDLQYHVWKPYFHSFDDWCETQIDEQTGEEKDVCQDGDNKITMSDVVRTFTKLNQDNTTTEIQVLADEFFNKYNTVQHTAKIDGEEQQFIGYWEMWGTYHYDSQIESNRIRREIKKDLRFQQDFWFNYDLNRDMSITMEELITSSMSNEEAITLFNHLQVPVSSHLDYETTKEQILRLEAINAEILYNSWIVLRNSNGLTPVTLASIDIDNPHVRQVLQVENQQELTELFAQLDKNSDGTLVFEEVCRHYIIDLDFFCSDRNEPQRNTPDHDFFEAFWMQINQEVAHDGIIEEAAWAAAVAEVSLFEDMDTEQIMQKFDLFDLNDDLIVTVEEARQVFHHGETIEDVVESVEEMWKTIDADGDGNMSQSEFIQTANVLAQLELIPLTEAVALDGLYMRKLGQYNEALIEAGKDTVSQLPMTQMINMMQKATLAAWLELLDGEE